MEEKMYAYWLAAMPGLGCTRIAALLERGGSAEGVYKAGEAIWKGIVTDKHLNCIEEAKKDWDVQGNYERMRKQGIGFVLRGDRDYPEKLGQIPDPPYALFYKGELPRQDLFSVAVIGARACSEYGRFVATRLGEELGQGGIQVISGMARGIDGISQEAALRVGGKSYGVLGSGVDVCYPKENRPIYDRLLKQGGILSEYVPGTMARAQNFPLRNRIVSGLCDVLVVVEAREKSGTLITVDMALEQGREVYVVPGRITDRLSDGCNRLLRQGAAVLLSPAELVQEIRRIQGNTGGPEAVMNTKGENVCGMEEAGKGKAPAGLSKEQHRIYDLLDYTPKSLEAITVQLGKSYNDCSSTQINMMLMEMCVQGLVRQNSPGHFSLPI